MTSKTSTSRLAIRNNSFADYSFILPAVAIFSVFYIFPFFYIFKLSLHTWDGIDLSMGPMHFDNFKDLMTDEIWWQSMGHAAYITLIALTFQNMLAFALALACDQGIRMRNLYRVIFFIPPILSEIVVGQIWRWILNPHMQGGEYFGLLNYLLHNIGLHHLVTNWLSNPDTALACIAVIHSWKGFGWGFVMLLAGLQMIDKELYEAARVDGAGSWKTFLNITLPMMIPVILVVVILTVLGSMQVFVLILSLVEQGLGYHTEVPVTRILSAMSGTKQYGYACAMGVVFGAILIAVSVVFKKISDKLRQA